MRSITQEDVEKYLTRYTDENGVGIYEAAMANEEGTKQERANREQMLLDALAESWSLPNPGKLTYKPGTISYFTPEGDEIFRKTHLPILKETVKKVIESRGNIGNVIYSDPYQVIGTP
jgi:hypothetical protein